MHTSPTSSGTPSPVPLIDISPLVTGVGEAVSVGAQIGQACRENGFFYITGHGVDDDLQHRLDDLSRRFFAQDLETKLQIRMALGGTAWRGYFPVGGELTSGKPDVKEGLYFGAELGHEDPHVRAGLPLHGPNLFPADLPALRETVLDYMAALTRLGHTLMTGLALSLGLEPSYFADRYTADPLTLFRIFHYPPVLDTPDKELSWGVGEHTDYGVLTILKQDDLGGLQVKSKGQWVDAPPVPGTFVCNIGDMLDRMTGGRYRSTPHRVRNIAAQGRLSFPFFFDPNFNARIAPIDLGDAEAPLDDQAARWDGASVHAFEGTYGDYVLSKVSKVFPRTSEAALLKNYLTIAVRNLYRHAFYAGLNITGLAIGLASCLLILLFVTDELSYDRFHKQPDDIYRLNWDFNYSDNEGVGPGTPPPLAAALANEIPEVEATTRLYPVADMVVRYEDTFFNESKIVGVDPTFFEIFSFSLLEGNPATALAEPGSVLLTETTAQKYFGQAPALGQVIHIGKDDTFLGRAYSSTFTVTGILEDPPHNTHFDFDMLTSMASHPQVAFFDWSWVWMQVATYARVDEGASIAEVETKVEDLVAARAPAAFERIGFSYDEMLGEGGHWTFVFQPLTDIYLGSATIGNRVGPISDRNLLYILSVVALFILLIACINFMNLATARATNRAKEVGVRKVLGSARRNLMGQFMTEALLFSVIAMLLAVGLAALFFVPFSQLAGKSLGLGLLRTVWFPAVLVGLTLVVGLLAGSYPSLYLSAFKPIEVLKGTLIFGKGGQRFRNGLVVLQFAISIVLMTGTLLVHSQMRFFRQADVGFDKEGMVVISNQNDRLGDQAASFIETLKSRPQVVNAARSTGVPPFFGFQDFYKVEGAGDEQVELTSYMVDDDFAATLGLDIVAGRGFSEDFPSSTHGVLLNERAVERLGWEQPVGKTITYPGKGDYEVIGVMKDFNFMTLHQPIVPFALFHLASESYTIPNAYVVVRVQQDDLSTTLAMIEEAWTTLAPGAPFEYDFLDETLQTQYRAEQRLETIFMIFAGLAMVIACLGLMGLAAFTAEKRTKEMGVRKTLGASVPSLLVLLVKDFTKWVLVANLIAWPVAWWAMDRWLQGFAYRVDISWQIFVLAGLAALMVAWLTVSYQSIKAALANPVESLRYE